MFPPFFSVLHANGWTVRSFSRGRVLPYPFQFIIASVIPLFDFISVNPSLPLSVHCFLFHGTSAPSGPGPPPCQGFAIKFRHTTLVRASLGEGSTPRRAFYLTTLTTHKRQKSISPAGFEPTIPASERPQTHALDSAVTDIDSWFCTDL